MSGQFSLHKLNIIIQIIKKITLNIYLISYIEKL